MTPTGLPQRLDALLQSAVATGAVPGVVAMVADRDGPIYEGAAGERTLRSGVPMTTDTVGLFASLTKAITSVAAVQLVERGQLSTIKNSFSPSLPRPGSTPGVSTYRAVQICGATSAGSCC